MRHIIAKQTFEIISTSIPVAQHWERKSNGIVRDIILPCLEYCFDSLAGGAENHLIFDRLEIELGEISEANFRQVIPERLKKAIGEALRDRTPQDISVDPGATNTEAALRPMRMSKRNSVVYAFISFLKFGLLPWWFEPSDASWSVKWVTRLGAEDLDKILEVVQTPVSRQRIIYQCNDDFLSAFITGVTELSMSEIVDIWLVLNDNEIDLSRQQHRQLRQEFWTFWLSVATQKAPTSEINDSYADFLLQNEIMRRVVGQLLFSEPVTLFNPAEATGFTKQVLYKVKKRLSEDIATALQRDDRILPQENQLRTSSGATDPVPKSPQGKSTLGDFSGQAELEARKKDITIKRSDLRGDSVVLEGIKKKQLLPEGIAVQDAGIVLLHPFFLELFKECELWHDGHWRQNHSAHKAVHLLSWLGCGNAELPEYLLPLHKTLCGVALEEPLETGIELSQRDINSCTDLLEAVIKHWTAIGKTSPDGLREGFLQRQGKLVKKKHGWLLTLEKKAQDVLLSKLPWGISIMSFPWMNGQQFHVDWT